MTGTNGCGDLWPYVETAQLYGLLVEARPILDLNRPICVIPAVGRSCGRYLSYQPTRIASATVDLRASRSISEQDALACARR